MAAAGMFGSASRSIAADVPFTQSGSVVCPNDAAGGAQCPYVTFPVEFGCTPNVYIPPNRRSGHSHMGMAPASITATNVTASGFLPSVVLPYAGTLISPVPGQWTASGPSKSTANINAKYAVLTVIYAPPGTKGGGSKSSVSYGAGSTIGTDVSASQSFKTSDSLDFSASALGNVFGMGDNFLYSIANTDTESIQIRQVTTRTITVNGPDVDGVDHDEDQIFLLVHPSITLFGCASNVNWLLTNTTKTHVQSVKVGELNLHQVMRPGVLAELQSAGITPAEYPSIKAWDPLADKQPTFDPPPYPGKAG